MRVLRDVVLGLACAAVGVALWLEIVESTGVLRAWDHGSYWTMAVPVMVVVSLIAGALSPERPWIWGTVLVGAQMAALLGRVLPEQSADEPSVAPVGLLFFAVLAAPCIAAGYFGAWLRRRASGADDVSVEDVPADDQQRPAGD